MHLLSEKAWFYSLALLSLFLPSCGSGEYDKDTSTSRTPTFDDIVPVLTQSCAVSGCHLGQSPAAGLDLSVISAEDFKKTRALERIKDNNTPMPPLPGPANPEGIALSADDKTKLIAFLTKN